MTTAAQLALLLLYLITLGGLFVYGVNAWVMLAAHRRHRRPPGPPPPLPDPLPVVTVQLPLFNERWVAARLLEAAGALDYPRDRLEIQVLDDSTDETADIVAAAVARLRARGIDAVHRRRPHRHGFKAGALAEGLASARGEFVAIFDADFVPPPDFLTATLPHFGPDVAAVQTRWGHLNRSFSALTVAQALGMDGHFGVEQSARAWSGLLLNFNGTAGVWRARAIHDAGGWQHDTLTEDLDLSYRAQLRGWRIVYRAEIVCPAELPVVITGFKSQQRRWAKGSIQTARKLLPAVLAAPLPAWTKYQAAVHLTYYMIHPLMLASLALLIPLRALPPLESVGWVTSASAVVFGVATVGPGAMLAYAQCVLAPGGWRRVWQLPAIMIFGVGVALSTSLAVLGAFTGGSREFVRTPKFGIAGASGNWRGKGYGERAAWGGWAELAFGAGCAVATWRFLAEGAHAVVPFLVLYTLGFLTVGWLTVRHSLALDDSKHRAARGAGGASRTLRAGRAASAVLLVGALATPVAGADPWRALVAEGERLWTRSPDPGNPVACATCHHDPAVTRGWAASFPKWRPLPPPWARVMTLLQANAEAVAKHYPSADASATALAITAYLTAHGAAVPVSPGIARGQPVFEHRMRALAESVERGRARYARRCAGCHEARAVASLATDLVRVVRGARGPVERFLERHGADGAGPGWTSPETADLLAYLTDVVAGRPVAPPPTASLGEGSR